MPSTSPLVTLLKQRPVEELENMRAKAEKVMETAKSELQWIDEALSDKRPKQKRRVTRKGDTKKRVLDFMRQTPEAVGPAEVRDALNATGAEIGGSTIYNTFKRLTDAGEIVRVDEGLYKIAARNGHRADEIGDGGGSLLTTTHAHEGQT